jgi:hypothetical protein
MRDYFADDWFWIVGDGPAGQVYASRRFAYVAPADAEYQAFLATGSLPTPIPTVAELRDLVLAPAEVRYLTQPLPPIEEKRPRIQRARCRLAIASFSLSHATGTAVPWDTEVADPLNMHGAALPDRIVIPETGWYDVRGAVGFAANGTGFRAAQLRLGPSQVVADTCVAAAPGRATTLPVGEPFFASEGEILRMLVEQNSGGALLVGARITLGRVE